MRSRAGLRSCGCLNRCCRFHRCYYGYLYILASAMLCRHTQGASVSVTLKGEVSLPHAIFTAIEPKTYDENVKQLHEYLANVTGLGASESDDITARFLVLSNPVKANFSWIKVVDASLELDLDRLSRSNVSTIVVVAAAAAATASAIDPKAAVAVIATLASVLFALLLALAVLAARAKWRRSSVGVIPALDVVRRSGVGDDCSFAETGTYRMRKYTDFGSTGGDLTADSTIARGDEAAIIRAWVQAQLRESHAAQQQHHHQQQQQQLQQLQQLHSQHHQPSQQQQPQHVQGSKKPSKRFSFRLIGKSMDPFDSGVASTAMSGRSCNDPGGDATPVASGTIRSVADVSEATLYATIGWTRRAATEIARAPIYRKNQPRRAPVPASGRGLAASADADLCNVVHADGESSLSGLPHALGEGAGSSALAAGLTRPPLQPSAAVVADVEAEVDIDAAVANRLRRVSSIGSPPPQSLGDASLGLSASNEGAAATAAHQTDGECPIPACCRSLTLPPPDASHSVTFRPLEASASATGHGRGSPELEDCRL